MYESLDRRRGIDASAGVHTRHVPVGAHAGDFTDYARRLERAAARSVNDRAAREEFFERVFQWISDDRNLMHALTYLALGDGHAPGMDGLTYDDLSFHERWHFVRELRDALRSGEYEPMPLRRCEISKGGNRGTRTLELPVIADRIVGRAVVQAVQPYLDARFHPLSFGFRPRRNRMHALAHAEAIARTEDRWTYVCLDVRNAFPSVPRRRLMDVVRRHLPDDRLVRLIELLAQNGKPRRGIPQGQPLMPLLLNLYLDHHLDWAWEKDGMAPLIRCADDFLVLCRNWEEAQAAINALERRLTPTGLLLKETSERAVHCLDSGASADWMGFDLTQERCSLRVHLPERSWERLEDRLLVAQHKPLPSVRAVHVIRGWVHQAGPAYSERNVRRDLSRVRSLALDLSFEELPSNRELKRRWQKGFAKWDRLREQLREVDLEGLRRGSADGIDF